MCIFLKMTQLLGDCVTQKWKSVSIYFVDIIIRKVANIFVNNNQKVLLLFFNLIMIKVNEIRWENELFKLY